MAICHDVDYTVRGDDLQFVEIGLDTGETVVAEAGAMMFLEEGIAFETKMGDGSEPDAGMFKKLKSAAGRAISQESVFLTHFTNNGGGRKVAAFGSDVPGKILPLDMGQLGGSILAQKDAFLAAALGTKLSVAFNRKLGSGFFGGEGFILQRIEGDGMAFLNAGGTIVEKHLPERPSASTPAASWPSRTASTTRSRGPGTSSRWCSAARGSSSPR